MTKLSIHQIKHLRETTVAGSPEAKTQLEALFGEVLETRAIYAKQIAESESKEDLVFSVPVGLDSVTGDELSRFASVLGTKLRQAELKHDYSTNWCDDTWRGDCEDALRQKYREGDILDLAIYCMFMHHHGWTLHVLPGPSATAIEAPHHNGLMEMSHKVLEMEDVLSRVRKMLHAAAHQMGCTRNYDHAAARNKIKDVLALLTPPRLTGIDDDDDEI